MVVLAASIVSKTGKRESELSNRQEQVCEGPAPTGVAGLLSRSPGLSSIHGDEPDQDRRPTGSFSQARGDREAAYLCGDRKCPLHLPADGGKPETRTQFSASL